MKLEDRYYTSTEVAEILGVSLRSVYRYMEDNKLTAEIKTATGRHRFTRQNIVDFLYPDGEGQQLFEAEAAVAAPKPVKIVPKPAKKEVEVVQPAPAPVVEEAPVEETPEPAEGEEEPVDWLAKFREAASKYKEDEEETPAPAPAPAPAPTYAAPAPVSEPAYVAPAPAPVAAPAPVVGPTLMYYRSMLGGLKDVAQNLDKSARNSNLDYAFTLYAGASLHKPVKPFATLHAYIRSADRDFYEKILRLTPANKDNAQLCLVISDDAVVYNTKEEIHGLYVVAKSQLKSDIATFGETTLAQEMADVL